MMKEDKYSSFIKYMKELGSAAVAFSGGVDSTFLLKAAHEALGSRAVAVTIVSPYIPKWEIEEAKELAKEIGVRHELIQVPEIPEEIRHNPADRCYLCKNAVFSMIMEFAAASGLKHVVDGTNADDINEYRPGLRALKELGVKSPLLENGLSKSEIREISKGMGLPTWDKPSYACLLSRIPYGTELEEEMFARIENSEKYLMDRGFRAVRVRCHGDLARIEVPGSELHRLFYAELLKEISGKLKEFGFEYVTLDMQGYRTGSLNAGIGKGD
jgi:uncharacterized protein